MRNTNTVNAVLLAGDRRASRQVRDDNKAFLELNGVPLFIHVLQALLKSAHIGRVVVVGPAERLGAAVVQHADRFEDATRFEVLEQSESMIENFKAGYVASLGLTEPRSFGELRGTPYEHVPVLVVPCDIPLMVPAELDEFIIRSNMVEYDYSIGVTSESVLSHYHPTADISGIQMIYFHVREDLLRHNNLHIAKPLTFAHLDYIEKMYEWRYQTRLANMLRMFFSLLFAGFRMLLGLRVFVLMQLSLYYDRHGHPRLSDRVRSWVSFSRMTDGIGNALGARVQVVYTHFGGAALDVDHSSDLTVVEAHYDEWMAYQEQLVDHSMK